MPLPTEPSDRRRLLRIWATISTPLLFVILALVVRSENRSILGLAVGAFIIVIGIEALTRRRLATYVIRLALLFALFSLGALIVAGLIASWQLTVVVLLLILAGVFLFLNVRELRRT